MFLLVPGLFIVVGILGSLSLLGVAPWFHFEPANWVLLIFLLAFGGVMFTFGAQAFLRRKWMIDSATVVRRTDIKLTESVGRTANASIRSESRTKAGMTRAGSDRMGPPCRASSRGRRSWSLAS